MVERGDILTLMQWLSPAFPVGGFAYSHGLEAAVHAGWVTDADDLRDWLSGVLRDGSGRSDAILLSAAYRSRTPADLDLVDATARAFAPARARLQEGGLQGAAFARTTSEVWGLDLPELMLPVAVGRAAGLRGLDCDLTCAAFLHAFTGNLVSAAIRLGVLAQTRAQAVQAALVPDCHDLAEIAGNSSLDDLASNAFLSDIAAMQHDTLHTRLFRS